MGISGLLPLLSPITKDIHIKDYANKRVAVDGYCWLHKAVYSCSQELCQGIPTTRYLHYCLNLISMMKSYKVIPVIVFDGGPLPNKRVTEDDRRAKRQQYKEKANAYLLEGNRAEANRCFQKAVDVTPLMAFNLIKELRRQKIEYVVAPYEADAQLAYLAITNQVDAILTEDSDLIAYGTPTVLFKMNKEGYCEEIKSENICSCKGNGLDFGDFNLTMLRQMCILAGCDYLPSPPGMGIKTSYKLFKQYKEIEKIFKYLKSAKRGMISEEYIGSFYKADATFKHARVYDPTLKGLAHFSPLDEEHIGTNLDFLGEYIENDIAEKIATGVICPVTRQLFDQQSTTAFAGAFIPQPKVSIIQVGSNDLIKSTSILSKPHSSRYDTNSKSDPTKHFTFKANRIDQYFDIITKTKETTNSENEQNDGDDPFVLDSDTDDFEFNFNDDDGNSTTNNYIVSPPNSLEWLDTNEDLLDESSAASTSTFLSYSQQQLQNNQKVFKKSSLVSDDRVSMDQFDQFLYRGQRKQSILLSSTNNNNNNINNNNNNSNYYYSTTNNHQLVNMNSNSISQPIKPTSSLFSQFNNNYTITTTTTGLSRGKSKLNFLSQPNINIKNTSTTYFSINSPNYSNNNNNNNNNNNPLNNYGLDNKRKQAFTFGQSPIIKRTRPDQSYDSSSSPPPTPESPFFIPNNNYNNNNYSNANIMSTTITTTTNTFITGNNHNNYKTTETQQQPQPQQSTTNIQKSFNHLVDRIFEDDDDVFGGGNHDDSDDEEVVRETPPPSPSHYNLDTAPPPSFPTFQPPPTTATSPLLPYRFNQNNNPNNNYLYLSNTSNNDSSSKEIGNLFSDSNDNSVTSDIAANTSNNNMNIPVTPINHNINDNSYLFSSTNSSNIGISFTTPVHNNNNSINNKSNDSSFISEDDLESPSIPPTKINTISNTQSNNEPPSNNNNNNNNDNISNSVSSQGNNSSQSKKYGSTSDEIFSKYFTQSSNSGNGTMGSPIAPRFSLGTPSWKERLSQRYKQSLINTNTSP